MLSRTVRRSPILNMLLYLGSGSSSWTSFPWTLTPPYQLHYHLRAVHGNENRTAGEGQRGLWAVSLSVDCNAKSEHDSPRNPCPNPHSYQPGRSGGTNASRGVPPVSLVYSATKETTHSLLCCYKWSFKGCHPAIERRPEEIDVVVFVLSL
ncbi:hypothetical protein EI94DRAFT_583690 [Lactarius quietus]|nr:hypothetical protein EI94DRAFT_583690 [Lactarius quietus]